ncbi:hypothetical protein AMATHDRAFT_1447 [Amanita thiersii Skay4041]|uniref:Ras GEF n=1 Tax=Amanita thiersii Skay4041 TaxID=703135 RepID=A0A2A9NZL4_9AGAR|nr:hypothetical protein AMATHDRAFT_1447 [Amanita thiersii Skay4041]
MHPAIHHAFIDSQIPRRGPVNQSLHTTTTTTTTTATVAHLPVTSLSAPQQVQNTVLQPLSQPQAQIQPQYHQEQVLELDMDDQFQTLFCRALYDYDSQDSSALSFRRGDIIEVLSQQPSGWWDGLLGDERGWFPSNYVVVISEDEAEQAFASAVSEAQQGLVGNMHMNLNGNGAAVMTGNAGTTTTVGASLIAVNETTPIGNMEFGRLQDRGMIVQQQQQQQPDQRHYHPSVDADGEVDLSHALMSRGMGHVDEEPWLSGETGYGSINSQVRSSLSLSSQPSDFWMPRVTPDNQIYYLNIQTGQQSRDLPQEADVGASESEMNDFASQPSSRSGTSTSLPYHASGHSVTPSTSSEQNVAGFDFFRRTGTPEPWVRRLADDGHSYYYLNRIDGSVQWIRPEPTFQSTVRDRSMSGSRSGAVPVPPLRTTSSRQFQQMESNSRLSVYSDDSDVQPLDHIRPRPQKSNGHVKARDSPKLPTSTGAMPDPTFAERIAKSLQHALAPTGPESVTALSAAAKHAIKAVVENIKPNDITRRPEEDQRMDDLIHAVVLAVRNLLYVSAIPTGQIPSSVLPKDYKDSRIVSSSQSPLKPAQRKVTATLSRLVLSARAMQYDSGVLLSDTITRIQSDAEELEKAVLSYVLEVQRAQHAADAKPLKRLHGVFSTANIGFGLVGAGAAASWKGFGWVPLSGGHELPKRILTRDVIIELGGYISRLDETTTSLSYSLRVSDEGSVDQIHVRSQELIAEISAMLSFIADIHVARHIDIDGLPMDGNPPSELYLVTVERARLLVRTLEASVQAVYDVGVALLMTTQTISASEFGQSRLDKATTYERLDGLCVSLKANMDLVQQTLDAILGVGHEQAETAQGEYNGSIEWRMSKVSTVHKGDQLATDGYEDLVDMAYAMNRGNSGSSLHPLANPPNPPMNQFNQGNPISQGLHASPDEHYPGIPTKQIDGVPPEPVPSPGLDDDMIEVTKSPPRQNAGNSKLAKIFGDEYADKVAKDSQPWYLRPNYGPNDILMDPDGAVRGGTLAALVERLTAHDQLDPTYTKAFLMTYKSFTTVDELFDLLVARFRIQAPPNLMPKEQEEWDKLKQRLIQIRVLNTLKSMVTDEDVLDKEDVHILDRMLEFVKSDEVSHLNAALQLRANIERAKAGGDALKTTQTNLGPPPAPIIPRSNKKLKLLDIEPLELARQLTIKESELYRKVKPMECLLRAREPKSETDNITVIIQLSNRIADWVADAILSKDDSRKRAATVKHLIIAADRCRTLNNFSSMIAITSGLNTPPIRRLKRTWDQINQRVVAQFHACEATIDSDKNFTKYRQLMQTVTPPCVPFIGVFLSTLQFIQDGNPDNLPGGLINFRKRQKASEVLSDIKRWQAQPFNLQVVPSVMNYLEESLNQFNDHDTRVSADRFWKMSLELEPKERDDEKMARLLQESGFL